MARMASGTSRIVIPASRSNPNSAPMNNSGAAIQAVNPSESGPPIAKPMNPAARKRDSGASGEPAHRWHKPRNDKPIRLAPRISRGRESGLGDVRISTTATAAATSGSMTTADPMNVRNKASTHAPSGRAASNHELAATTTARPSSTSAIPSRRCPGSMSRARPIDRAAPPVPLAAIIQTARMARPQASPVDTSSDRWCRREGLPTPLTGLDLFLGTADRALRDAPREVAFDLLVRVPERATVLLDITASLVAITPSTPSATLVTAICSPRCQGLLSRVTSDRAASRRPTRGVPGGPSMPVVVVATLTAKPESVDTVRDILTRAVDDVHREPGCQLYALHETGETFIFVEQWADAEALKAHSGAPAVATMFTAAGEHLVGAPDIKLLQPVPAGDPSKGQLRR
ncbi:antibiotic biosynthesis monooxygenase domain-containing protein [Mycobacterium tuberculosis]|nr:antibiotic biosynthesis monooxygenase domain-containing protein [Mycobacterium tuberculosis]CKS97284.1 antibiotic biosynthesis monooxygenase domain-containing protein [Mycobacterium tuberculosis]CKT06018.1 antibiotic biosynthesis monooxygenase domain-containing protein [Mycobacterium tuberculosis]